MTDTQLVFLVFGIVAAVFVVSASVFYFLAVKANKNTFYDDKLSSQAAGSLGSKEPRYFWQKEYSGDGD